MKSAPPEASSDLERARALSRALTAVAPPKSTPILEAPAYTRLARAPQPIAASPALPSLSVGARWPAIVAWAAGLEGAGAALALDRKGLLVAVSGLPDDEATRIGGRVALAFDQMVQIDEVLSLAIEGPRRSVHVASFGEGEEAVLLAVLGSAVPSRALCGAVTAALAAR